jgi:hypothetical protein
MALEHLDVADAILEADNGRAGPSVGGDFLRGISVAPLFTQSAMMPASARESPSTR